MQTNSPHVFNVPAAALQYTQRNRKQRQNHHPGHVKALFEIKNKRTAGPQEEGNQQQRYHPEHIHSDQRHTGKSHCPAITHYTWFGGMRKPLKGWSGYGARRKGSTATLTTITQAEVVLSRCPGGGNVGLWLPTKMNMYGCSSVAKWHHEVESSRHRLCFIPFPVCGPPGSDVTRYTPTHL